MKLVSVVKSDRPEKKLMATFENEGRTKTVHFGSANMMDYTLYTKKDGSEVANERKRLYRLRHKKDLKGDVTKPGYLSYHILWNLPTVSASIADYKRRFNL